MHSMKSSADTRLSKRIRQAIEHATLKRDRYAALHGADLTATLKVASNDIARQILRFEQRTSLLPWQPIRLMVLKDLEMEIDSIAADLRTSWKVGLRRHAKSSLRLGIEDGLGQLETLQAPKFKDLSDRERSSLVTRVFSTIDRAAVDSLATYELQLLGDVSTQLAAGIKRTIMQGVLTGGSIPDIAHDIGRVVEDPEAFRHAGKTVFKTTQQRAMTVAKTETLRAHNKGCMALYRDVGVRKVRWITAHDERTCPECGALDGRVFAIDDLPGLPCHPLCRCYATCQVR